MNQQQKHMRQDVEEYVQDTNTLLNQFIASSDPKFTSAFQAMARRHKVKGKDLIKTTNKAVWGVHYEATMETS